MNPIALTPQDVPTAPLRSAEHPVPGRVPGGKQGLASDLQPGFARCITNQPRCGRKVCQALVFPGARSGRSGHRKRGFRNSSARLNSALSNRTATICCELPRATESETIHRNSFCKGVSNRNDQEEKSPAFGGILYNECQAFPCSQGPDRLHGWRRRGPEIGELVINDDNLLTLATGVKFKEIRNHQAYDEVGSRRLSEVKV